MTTVQTETYARRRRNQVNEDAGLTHRRAVVVASRGPSRSFLVRLLRGSGYTVSLAASPKQFLEQVGISFIRGSSEHADDVMILDLRDRDSSVLSTLQAMRKRERPRSIIAITAANDDESFCQAVALGASAVLAAPIDADTLVETLFDVAPPYEFGTTWH